MTQEKEQAELVEFEIVRGSEETAQSPLPVEAANVVSPWQVARFVLLGLAGVALFFIVLGFGAMLLIPVLVFITITRFIRNLTTRYKMQ